MKIQYVIAFAATALISTSALAQPAGGPAAGMSMPGMGAMGPTQVGVITMKSEAAPITTTLPGRVIASATAEVRPQVGGVVTEVRVTEGRPVAAGDLIATVDAASYEADVAIAQASLASARAQLPNAQSKAQRYETLVSSGGVSEAERDTARVELAQAEATLASAEAQVRAAELTLERTKITAPIAGIVGSVNVQVGSLLTANQADALTTIRQIDPVDITLVESSLNLLSARSAMRGAPQPSQADASEPPPLEVTLILEDGSTYEQVGSISTMDLVVSETTGTFTLRASMPNPDRVLLPGMFVRATIKFGAQDNVFLVPQRAVTFNANGKPTAYFVSADGKAEQRELTAERVVNNSWVVTEGVADGDKLIVDGLQKIRDGGEVSQLDVTIEDNGVVYQDAPAAPTAPQGSGMPPRTPPTGTPPSGATLPAGATPPSGGETQPATQQAPPTGQEGN
jgi:membrane fusion protein (multidrug efflux system)